MRVPSPIYGVNIVKFVRERTPFTLVVMVLTYVFVLLGWLQIF
ncbi:MAG: hypothetical protein QXY40_01910 [Candidatus Methanomethylicia archaeon]